MNSFNIYYNADLRKQWKDLLLHTYSKKFWEIHKTHNTIIQK